MSSYYGIGVMSGTSLDGLDMCAADFTGDSQTDVWSYTLDHAVTVPYSKEMRDRLATATTMSALELHQLQTDFSHFVGQCLQRLITSKQLKVDFVASHGHTVFHQPEKGITLQIGDGEIISTYLTCPFVCNFRSKDVSLGGQGAPLVPCGERFLFQQTDVCINLGGIANVGHQGDSGFDVCPCNMVLNHLAQKHDADLSYDKNGEIAATGQVIKELADELNELDFYKQTGPKSLGYEWVANTVFPLLNTQTAPVADLLRTYVEHISHQVSKECVRVINKTHGSVMVTGGGAFNSTLMEDLKAKLKRHNIKVVETDTEIIEYKEAIVFGFLGLRSLLGAENVFSNVTGSKHDTISGSIHHGGTGHLERRHSLTDRFNFMVRQKTLDVKEYRIVQDK